MRRRPPRQPEERARVVQARDAHESRHDEFRDSKIKQRWLIFADGFSTGRPKLKSGTHMIQIGRSSENPSIQTILFRYPIKCPGIATGGAYLRHTRVSRANSPGFVCYSGANAALLERLVGFRSKIRPPKPKIDGFKERSQSAAFAPL